MDAPIRVVLIDDSAVVRGALRRIIEPSGDIVIAGTASNGRLGLEAVAAHRPDVVLLDIEMPEMDGMQTLPRLLAANPGLKVIMASSLTQRGAQVTMDALALGAADYITKPTARAGPDALAPMAAELLGKIRGLARPHRHLRPATPLRTRAVGPESDSAPIPEPTTGALRRGLGGRAPELIAIASSTGGPNALAQLFKALPNECKTPIVVTQHMPPLFTQMLAQRLTRESGRTCVEASDRMPVQPGHTYIAPGDKHLLVERENGALRIRLSDAPPENHCRPSADVMFRSIANAVGGSTLVVVLTGMGEDGKRGADVLRRAGARVLAQDEASSVVWGMPGAVVAAGLADQVLTLPLIAQRIAHLELALA
ncbi:MAG: chemotaxis response regulator protein-glutamate methylesterase [Gemmatimonadaceae bacterium]|nr:chemotaxis response regulator protein-glutamate methylesterase [Gemmatimonadaceae bacterium]